MAIDSVQYKRVFDLHYEALYGYACSILKAETYAEDIVQNVFVKLWQGKDLVKLETVKAYLYTAVRNESLNHLKHQVVQASYAKSTLVTGTDSEHNQFAEQRELYEKVQNLLNLLPEKCATVFYMCRQLGFSYKEVAQALDISIKTVENQMSKALRVLRTGLAEYLVSLLPLFIIQFINL